MIPSIELLALPETAGWVTPLLAAVAVFGLAGFAFAPFLPFLALMLLATLAGNWLGRMALVRLDDARFRRLLAVVLTVLAARLLYLGASGLGN